jgi:transcriptional regulator with XRE-family HTH domain
LELSNRAAVSTRHLSYVETGRSQPSRELLLHLAEELDVPLRERNTLLVAAGFAPVYRETPIDAPEMGAVREALERVLHGHEPYPAVVVNRHWELVLANDALALLVEGVAPELLEAPVNVLRVALHPDGLARRVANFDEYSAHLVGRLRREVDRTGDAELAALLAEVQGHPGVSLDLADLEADAASREVVLPVILDDRGERLSFFSTISTFGTAIDITLADLAVEAFFPADDATSAALRRRFG